MTTRTEQGEVAQITSDSAGTIRQKIKEKREPILLGEIGALLHDIGKCRGDFVEQKSVEGKEGVARHESIDDFLDRQLIDLFKRIEFDLEIKHKDSSVETVSSDIYELVTEHHSRSETNLLVKLLQQCDRLDSADDKGIIRKKQPRGNVVISTPFGCAREKINFCCLDTRLQYLERKLFSIIDRYVEGGEMSLQEFRKQVMDDIHIAFSHALGETRIPANDVTLWDHSYSTASLYKTLLCQAALDGKIAEDDLKWRLFGIFWDGEGFIDKGNKVADILERKKIIDEVHDKLKEEFEVDSPVGNAVYQDINGIIFTFPSLAKDAIQLAEECSDVGWDIILEESQNELWPFFTLSEARRSMTMISWILDLAEEKRKIPKMSPALFVEDDDRGKKWDRKWLGQNKNGINAILSGDIEGEKEICPVCKIRPKERSGETCAVCGERRGGRLNKWLKEDRSGTIWLSEVADENNRIALLGLNLGLRNWLDGTTISTIYSQTFEDWYKNKKMNTKKMKDLLNKIEAEREGLRESNLQEFALCLIEKYLVPKDRNIEDAALIFNTFFEDLSVGGKTFEKAWGNFCKKLPDKNPETILATLFTQNSSPARLFRIWKEAKEFWDLVLQRCMSGHGESWQRLSFKVETVNNELEKNTPYIFRFKILEPDNLLVLHVADGQFLTIESLHKFKMMKKTGEAETEGKEIKGMAAVEKALEERNLRSIEEEENPEKSINFDSKEVPKKVPKVENVEKEHYFPHIEILNTPLLFQVIVPAQEATNILKEIDKLFNERFKMVTGKLPLNAGLLVANRKFPLYLLLEAGRKILRERNFQKQTLLDPWWDISEQDEFHRHYPLGRLSPDRSMYYLNELAPLAKGKSYALYPGYFDFDLIKGGGDCRKLVYKNRKRTHGEYLLLSNRPCYFYQFGKMIDLWEILENNLSVSQIQFINEAISSKKLEWRNIEDRSKDDVLQIYAKRVLLDAFGGKWPKLSEETRNFIFSVLQNNLLLDTINLFQQTIKENGGKKANEIISVSSVSRSMP
ncbi:MAG: CRISPR-associated protein Csx11 [Firmicutes bacterium]|jgi:CRISPR-associated Csx11 family protein|nr:CRISPR-associated protein Csx11 [Bacillota bacterium]